MVEYKGIWLAKNSTAYEVDGPNLIAYILKKAIREI